jgi:hypothetical protein
MRGATREELALLCLALEALEPETEKEEELRGSLLSRVLRDPPFAPYRSPHDWRMSL